MIKNRISIFITTFIIVGFFFLALPEKGYTGTDGMLPPIEACCQLVDGCFDLDGHGGEDMLIRACLAESVVVGVCNESTGLCEPLAKNVPTLSEWSLIAMAGFLGLVGFMIVRRKNATA